MKILILCSYRNHSPHTNFAAPFIYEQVQSLEKIGCIIDYLYIKGGGLTAYLTAIPLLKKEIKKGNYDIIHAHGGLCGFIANLQRKLPVITTYHGSDINNSKLLFFSKKAIQKSAYNIFVTQKLFDKVKPQKDNCEIIPCGIDIDLFYPKDKLTCRENLGLDVYGTYILFSKAFHVKVKNYPLAKMVVDTMSDATLIELKGYTREQVSELMNAVDVALMTSFTEGSPQFIKEAMACNCPIVSTDVGDVKSITENVINSYVTTYEPDDIKDKIEKILLDGRRTNGRVRIIELALDNESIARKIKAIYENILLCQK